MADFYLPICLFEFTVLIYAVSEHKFSPKTHTFILLMTGCNYLGSIHLDDGFVFCCAGKQMWRHDAVMHRDPDLGFMS